MVGQNEPIGHTTQSDTDVLPVVSVYLPRGHFVGTDKPTDGQYEPAGHVVGIVKPSVGQYEPIGHLVIVEYVAFCFSSIYKDKIEFLILVYVVAFVAGSLAAVMYNIT